MQRGPAGGAWETRGPRGQLELLLRRLFSGGAQWGEEGDTYGAFSSKGAF